MNTFQLRNPNRQLEPEELESWEAKDFDDVLESFVESEQEMELTWNDSLRWHAAQFH